ncbi:MAG: HAD family hydrolase [Lachnospiraceae bacterium]|nr:HAD family hydrolase [Lachnospiraceae bacterium]
MITTVMFDMGGTLEDIWVDAESERAAIEKLDEMLKSYGLDPKVSYDELKAAVDAGWVEYGKYRDATQIELKPIPIWKDYVLKSFGFPDEQLIPHCEEIAHMWEITHYHRGLRPRVREMLDALKADGLRLGVISNTAALFQVFDSLEEYGIRDCFDDVTLSSVTGLRKPCTDIFTVSMRELRCAPENCVYVGDTVSRDIIGSKRAGYAAAIQIKSKLTGEKDAGIAKEFMPDYIVEDIYDVYDIVAKLNGKA